MSKDDAVPSVSGNHGTSDLACGTSDLLPHQTLRDSSLWSSNSIPLASTAQEGDVICFGSTKLHDKRGIVIQQRHHTDEGQPCAVPAVDPAPVLPRPKRRRPHGQEGAHGQSSQLATSQVVYDGFVTFENGNSVNGPREKAAISIDNITNKITVTLKQAGSVFVGPGYPIVIEGPMPNEDKTDD